MSWIYLFVTLVVVQRIVEVVIANRNALWMKKQGGYEAGKRHYKFIVATHCLFFIGLLTEVSLTWNETSRWWIIPLVIFLLAQLGRVWALSSLGRFWNTRIMILPGANVVAKGPYQYVRHPNYVIVATEIVMLPLIFQAFWTAIIFTVLNAWVLSVRIKVEEEALKEMTNYKEVFAKRSRFMPRHGE